MVAVMPASLQVVEEQADFFQETRQFLLSRMPLWWVLEALAGLAPALVPTRRTEGTVPHCLLRRPEVEQGEVVVAVLTAMAAQVEVEATNLSCLVEEAQFLGKATLVAMVPAATLPVLVVEEADGLLREVTAEFLPTAALVVLD